VQGRLLWRDRGLTFETVELGMRFRRGAIVIGGYASAVGVVRELACAGVPVDVVLTMPQDIAHYSRFVRRHHWLLELQDRPESLVELLEARRDAWRGWAIVPTNDYAVIALARYRDRLERHYAVTVPPWEITRRIIDKGQTYRIASAVGIATPRSYGPATRKLLQRAELQFPVLVKPNEGHVFATRFGKKLFLARSRVELDLAIERADEAGLCCEVYELIPGPDNLFYDYQVYIDRNGHPVGEFCLRKLRLAPPHFGVARACETADVAELREPTLELLRRLEWRGPASVCYKQDPRDGRFRLIEVNGRSVLPHGLARRVGINYALMGYSESVHGTLEGDSRNGWRGFWIHLHEDLLYTAMCLRSERLSWRDFRRSYLGPKTFPVWSRRDPVPFFAEWANTVRKAPRTLLDRRSRAEILGRVQSVSSVTEQGN
jgi:predicted ATP-grasp superfamily ATP-dependent carboligase